MSLNWLPRDNEPKDHFLFDGSAFNTQAPGVLYVLKPIVDVEKERREVDGLFTAWIFLNNPDQYNSYTTAMVKEVIAAFNRASTDPRVVAVVFTAVGDRAFCTGGNTKEYAEHYGLRPEGYRQYMGLFNAMVDAILNCQKPAICRVNGMRVAGGQEIGMACDITVAADTAVFGQAGPQHGSAPVGGSTDFLPMFLTIEDAMWNCISCKPWSAYKMKMKGLISRVTKVLREDAPFVKFVCNPLVVTDRFIDDGEIVYGEFVTGEEEEAKAKERRKSLVVDFVLLDQAVDEIVWTLTNLFPGCLIESIDGIRQKKRFWWDQCKSLHQNWLAGNMTGEGFLGFTAFNNRKLTGRDVIDFVRFRQLLASDHPMNEELYEAVLPKPLPPKE